jgi:RNA polymerase sigma factor (sigma-70 family)
MTTGTEISDHDLLRQYIAGSDSAFTALVARNIDAVYSAARRQVRDPHLAEDVTQAVFLILARKAWTLRSGVVIPAWLHRATRYCSANALRTQANRLRHERRAAQMKQDATADDWENVSAALDEAVNRLPDAERKVIILRFFQGKGHAQVAAEMGISLAAATKRSNRALERLRNMLGARGATAAVLGETLASNAIHPAPPHLLAAASTAPANPSTAAIARGATKMMLFSELKIIAMFAAVLLTLSAATTAILLSSPQGSALSSTTVPATQNPPSPTATQPPSTQPSWRPAFDAIYTLNEGEIIRNIRPPFIPQRDGFIRDVYDPDHVDGSHSNGSLTDIKAEATTPPGALFLPWNPATRRVEHWSRANGHGWQLESLVVNLVGLTPDQTIVPESLGKIPVPGDWVIRKGATPDQKLPAFESICRNTPAAFTAVKQSILRDVIVAHGTYHKGDAKGDMIVISLDTDKGRERQRGDPYYYFRKVGDNLHLPVINEWAGCDDVRIEFTSPKLNVKDLPPIEARQKLQMLLDEIGAQLGIQLTAEKRNMDTWVFTPGNGT